MLERQWETPKENRSGWQMGWQTATGLGSLMARSLESEWEMRTVSRSGLLMDLPTESKSDW